MAQLGPVFIELSCVPTQLRAVFPDFSPIIANFVSRSVVVSPEIPRVGGRAFREGKERKHPRAYPDKCLAHLKMLQVNSGDRHLSKSSDISAGSAQKQGKRGDYLDSTGGY